MDLLKLGDITKGIFLEEEKFQMKKVITDFNSKDGRFLGDFWSFLIREEVDGESPIFYSIVSSFDAIGKTETEASNIYRDGEILYSGDFKKYTGIRTGLLSPLICKTLDIDFSDKKILIVGSGRTAKNGIKALYSFYPKISKIFYTNKSGKNTDFESHFEKSDLSLEHIEKPNFGDYDYIAFHTNNNKPILKNTSEIKDGAIISSHISSSDFAEYDDTLYKEGNVIVDWHENLSDMKDLQRAISKKYLAKNDIISFKDILNSKKFKTNKRYTLIRSTGTPMQNIAVLKYLYNKI